MATQSINGVPVAYCQRHDDGWGGWYRDVCVNAVMYKVSVKRSNPRRLAYGGRGWWWTASVYVARGSHVWTGSVTKKTSLVDILRRAGLLNTEEG